MAHDRQKGGEDMIKYLGRKQSSKNADWLYAMENIERLISREEVNDFAEKAVADVRRESAGIKAAYAWSGGKDSIVLGDICEKAGIETGYFAYSELDYPEFVCWCMEHKPDGVIPINTGYDLEWLSRHQNLIFAEGQLGQRWHIINQRGPFTDMFFDNGLDILVVGHRVIDGNVCGADGYIRKKSGEVRYAPLANWPHEAILGYIHYNHLSMPPIYDWKDGFVIGTHAWPEREFCKSVTQGYQEVYDIDRSIVENAALVLSSARHFLEREVGRG